MVVIPLRERGDAVLLFVDEILYRQLTDSDFRNIEGISNPNGGGGQRYIDLSGIAIEDVEEFFKYCDFEDEGSIKGVEKRTRYSVAAIVTGTTLIPRLSVYRRRDTNYTIADQRGSNRYPGWSSEYGFPTVVGDGQPFEAGGKYDNSITDPYVRPITAHLTVYIVRTLNHLYFADFVADSSLPGCWPKEVGLEALIKDPDQKRSAGVIRPTKLIQFLNVRESLDAHGV